MKKTLIVTACLAAGAMGAYAQGTIAFNDHLAGTLEIQIYSPQVATPTVETTGNSAADIPAGTQVYTGTAIGGTATGSGPTGWGNGNNYTAELFALGATSLPTSPAAFTALSPVSQYESTFYTVSAGTGLFKAVSPSSDPGISGTGLAGSPGATVSVAVWYNGGGTITSLAAAQAANVPYGWSAPYVQGNLGNVVPTGGTPNPAPSLGGLTSFSLVTTSTVPEPCTFVLGLLGTAGFLLRRRK